MRDKIIAKLVRAWAAPRLGETFQDLANMAHADLWYGPYQASDYAEECPDRKTVWTGFQRATHELASMLDTLPSKIWVDIDCEWVSEEEPLCATCDGTGETCESCGGTGQDIGIELGTTYLLDHSDIKRYLLGKELAQ